MPKFSICLFAFMKQFFQALREWNAKPLLARDYSFIALVWIFFELVWFLNFGFNFEQEARKYINEANFFRENNNFSQARFLFYSTTIFINYLSSIIGTGIYGTLVFLLLFNLSCCLFFFRACAVFFGSKIKSFLIVLSLLSFWPYQEWTLTLYSDSFYYSSILLLTGHILLFRQLTIRYVLLLIFLLLMIVFTRPTGILMVFSVLAFIFFYLNKVQKMFFVAFSLLSTAGLVIIVQIVFTTTSDWNVSRALLDENMICDIPVKQSAYIPALSNSPNHLYQFFYFIVYNFSHFIGLALPRLKLFFFMIRDYYSVIHNVYLLLCLLFSYATIVIGFKRIKVKLGTARVVFIFTSFVFLGGVVALQCDDYHNRFFLSLFPLLVLSTATAVFSYTDKFFIFSESYKY